MVFVGAVRYWEYDVAGYERRHPHTGDGLRSGLKERRWARGLGRSVLLKGHVIARAKEHAQGWGCYVLWGNDVSWMWTWVLVCSPPRVGLSEGRISATNDLRRRGTHIINRLNTMNSEKRRTRRVIPDETKQPMPPIMSKKSVHHLRKSSLIFDQLPIPVDALCIPINKHILRDLSAKKPTSSSSMDASSHEFHQPRASTAAL